MKLLGKEYPSQRHKQLQRLGMENSLAGAETKGNEIIKVTEDGNRGHVGP